MVESRWVRWIGPGVLALGAAGLITSATLGGADRPWAPRACAGPPGDRTVAARGDVVVMEALPREAWFRLDPQLGADGALRGQRLRLGLGGDRIARSVDLPAESFAAGPFGRIVLVGSDDGATSRLEALDVANGCAWAIAEEGAVIRRATVDAAGTRIYETRVDRSSRADLGIWVRPMDGQRPARRVLAPLPSDDRFGRTFSTEFTWDLAGGRLAIQACGEIACRTRVTDPAGGPGVSLGTADLGPIIGLAGDRIVSYLACRGLPCPIVATDLSTSRRHVLTPDGGAAALVTSPHGAQVVHEATTPNGRRLRSIDLADRIEADLGPLPDGLTIHPTPAVTGSAMRLPAGWVLLTPEGRLPLAQSEARPLLRRIGDGSTVPFDEVMR
jgi:hypothetical protein